MYGASDFNSHEDRLRKRIRNAFGQEERSIPESEMRPIEQSIIALMEAYLRAAVEKREAVFEEHAAKLLNTIGVLRRDYPPRRSFNVR